MSAPWQVYCVGIVPPSMNDELVRENFIGLPVDGAERISVVAQKARHQLIPRLSTRFFYQTSLEADVPLPGYRSGSIGSTRPQTQTPPTYPP